MTQLRTWVMIAPSSALFMAFVFAKLLSVLDQASADSSRHADRMSGICAIMSSLFVPHQLKQRVLLYHTFLCVHNVNKGAYEDLFSGLSKNLHQELKLHLFEALVQEASFFQEVPAPVIMQMVMA